MACKVGTTHRHPELGLSASHHISHTSSDSRSPQTKQPTQFLVASSRVFRAYETGISTVPHKSSKIMRFKGKKGVRVLCSAESATATSGTTQQDSPLFLYRFFEQENRIQIYRMQLHAN
jgi:hypothetical protein